MQTSADRINYYNILWMLLASIVACIIPFELVLLSYAILGPGHYLTEISWLKQKNFFTIKKFDYLLILGAIIAALLYRLPLSTLIYCTFGLALICLLIRSNLKRLTGIIILIAGGHFLLRQNVSQELFGLYIPTLIHVYLFTGAFMLYGALKGKHISGYLALLVFIGCPLFLYFAVVHTNGMPTSWAAQNYRNLVALNRQVLGIKTADLFNTTASIALTRVIAFAYTYHYINWFSKTEIINWHKMSVFQWTFIIIIWTASVGLYFYDYLTGMKWLFMLSLLHVILEFPLNQQSFIAIGRELAGRAGRVQKSSA